MYQVSGTEVVELWLGRHKDPAERLALLAPGRRDRLSPSRARPPPDPTAEGGAR